MSDFFGKLKSGAGKVAFDADKMGRVNKAKGEIGKLKQQIDALYLKLGEITYSQFANPNSAAPDISEMCQNITELNRQIGVKNEDIQRINAEILCPAGCTCPRSRPAGHPGSSPGYGCARSSRTRCDRRSPCGSCRLDKILSELRQRDGGCCKVLPRLRHENGLICIFAPAFILCFGLCLKISQSPY